MEHKISNYQRKKLFSSFLPGISGVFGIPMWVFYMNRGQAISSFGIHNKDNSIMEFDSAHIAQKNINTEGFRTFIVNENKELYEPFKVDANTDMTIKLNGLEISDSSHEFATEVNYYPVMERSYAGLIREVTITNKKDKQTIEIFDGMPEIIPFGLEQDILKNIPTTGKAWMQVEKSSDDIPFYKTRISTKDEAQVQKIENGYFYISKDHFGDQLDIIVDPEILFDFDKTFSYPFGIMQTDESIEERKENQNYQNIFPSAFAHKKVTLDKNESITIYSTIGFAENIEKVDVIYKDVSSKTYYTDMKEIAEKTVSSLLSNIDTTTADEKFNAYTKQTYLDNFLRGGYPLTYGEKNNKKPLYVYGRKHGDLERDYNFFEMSPEYFSQGNGNYRDINQNRRNDVFMNPEIGRENIKQFISYIQMDGYNPLVIKENKYKLNQTIHLEKYLNIKDIKTANKIMEKEFTIGELLMNVELLPNVELKVFLDDLISKTKVRYNAEFSEGYWSDHWVYNLDLIKDYLSVFPDKVNELLWENDYSWFNSPAYVKPREERYTLTDQGYRQYNNLEETDVEHTWVIYEESNREVRSNLIEKITMLISMKMATLDPYGMGIEMEGGKPGWYDALNGLPGLFGSSTVELYELKTLVDYLIDILNRAEDKTIEFHQTLYNFIKEIRSLSNEHLNNNLTYWKKVNDVKEIFRKKNRSTLNNKKEDVDKSEIISTLETYSIHLDKNIKKIEEDNDLSFNTYYYYELVKDENGYQFKQHNLPPFLEGAVKYLKISNDDNKAKDIHSKVKKSGLYDKKLDMYKVNASLESTPLELGRCRAFSRGWLENESIWMHMEYKYLLELLRNGLYSEFFDAFNKAGIPFLDEETFGRSTLENVSFIASSANPNEDTHGQGFVARLSGSTAEFINMWKIMFFGETLFKYKNEELIFELSPTIPDYLIGNKNRITSTLFSEIEVTYEIKDKKELIPGDYNVTQYELIKDFKTTTVEKVTGNLAEKIRNKEFDKIRVTIQ